MAHGNKMAARNMPPPLWRSIATGKPMSSSAATATAVKYAVVPSADQKRPSETRKRKLASPTKRCSWKTTIERCRLSQTAASTGTTATPARMATEGAAIHAPCRREFTAAPAGDRRCPARAPALPEAAPTPGRRRAATRRAGTWRSGDAGERGEPDLAPDRRPLRLGPDVRPVAHEDAPAILEGAPGLLLRGGEDRAGREAARDRLAQPAETRLRFG